MCELCAGTHANDQCTMRIESMQYMGNYNRQQPQNNQNSYNPGWRNHPNFSWSNNQATRQAIPPGFQNQFTHHAEKQPSLEDALARFITATERRMNDQDKLLNQVDLNVKSQAVSIKNLENQMGQLAHAINNRPQGALPSDTEVNPKSNGKEHCKAITLRSGKELTVLGEGSAYQKSLESEDIDKEKIEVEEVEVDKSKVVRSEARTDEASKVPLCLQYRFHRDSRNRS